MAKYPLSILLLYCLMASLGCERRPNVQGNGEQFLQGAWREEALADSAALLTYTMYQFKFTCDSFYVQLTTHAKVNYYEESCFNGGLWKEYAKGVYSVRKDSLFLDGLYTKSNYKQKVSGCYQSGRFLKSFIVERPKPDTLLLKNTIDQRQSRLALIQKIICIPKAL